MNVYKFRTVDAYSLTGLANNEIWFSSLKDFNDPFEGSYIFDEHEYSKQDKEEINLNYTWSGYTGIAKDNLDKYISDNKINNFHSWSVADKCILVLKIDLESIIRTIHSSKAVCLSRQYINKDDFINGKEKDTILDNLMWSHYSSGLRGFCLVFDDKQFYDGLIKYGDVAVITSIKYQNTPEALELKKWHAMQLSKNRNNLEDVAYVYKSIATKSLHWKYEKEIRFVSTNRSTSKRKYEPSSLIEIVIGEKMPLDQQKLVINTALSANSDIKIKIAKIKSNSYELEVVDYIV